MGAGSSDPGPPVKKALTVLEFSALELASRGVATADNAEQLRLSVPEVAAVMVGIRDKLGVTSTQQAALLFTEDAE